MVVPFALLPPLSVWCADRLASAGAASIRPLSIGLARLAGDVERPAAGETPLGDDDVVAALAPVRPAPPAQRSESAPASRAHRPHRIFVGPDLVRRATPPSARPHATWSDRRGDRPAGMLVQSAGALAGVLVPGDVLFEAEGQPIAGFEGLVSIVGQAYQRRARYVSGRLYRSGEIWAVTVEPGW
jgi:hypothetical protein